MSAAPAMPASVAQCFEAIAPDHRAHLLHVRGLIFDAAVEDTRIGEIEEALRWREPAYLTPASKSGSTIRLGMERGSNQPAVFFNCKTTLVEEFRQQFGTALSYSKNRAVLLTEGTQDRDTALRFCIQAALTYHLRG